MRTLGVILAILLHVGILLFGGIFLLNENEKKAREEQLVEIEVEEEPPKKPDEEKPEDKPEDKKDETPPEETPQFTAAPAPDQPAGPALSQLSLSDLESMMSGAGGAGGCGGGGGLSSGGVAGGTGSGGGGDGDGILSGGQLDQKPKLIDKTDPKPPANLAKSLPQVTVTVFMDSSGRVTRADVQPAVAGPAQKAIIDAVMKWRYEPGQRGGKKVASKVSHKISFN